MDQQAITRSAERLREKLAEYAATKSSAAALQKTLTPLINEASQGCIQQPLDRRNIPGSRTFDETDARALPGLETAYSVFVTEVTGGEPEFQRLYRERHGIAR